MPSEVFITAPGAFPRIIGNIGSVACARSSWSDRSTTVFSGLLQFQDSPVLLVRVVGHMKFVDRDEMVGEHLLIVALSKRLGIAGPIGLRADDIAAAGLIADCIRGNAKAPPSLSDIGAGCVCAEVVSPKQLRTG